MIPTQNGTIAGEITIVIAIATARIAGIMKLLNGATTRLSDNGNKRGAGQNGET